MSNVLDVIREDQVVGTITRENVATTRYLDVNGQELLIFHTNQRIKGADKVRCAVAPDGAQFNIIRTWKDYKAKDGSPTMAEAIEEMPKPRGRK